MAADVPLKHFGLLCAQITGEPSLTIKEEIVSGFVLRYTGDVGLLMKLLLPKYAGRVFYLQEKQLVHILAIVLMVEEPKLWASWNSTGCIAETALRFFTPTTSMDRDGWCGMSMSAFDHFLDELAAASTEMSRVEVLQRFVAQSCTHALYLLLREVKMDLRLGAGLRVVLGGLHPSAYSIFQHSADVQVVVQRVLDLRQQQQQEQQQQPSVGRKSPSIGAVRASPWSPPTRPSPPLDDSHASSSTAIIAHTPSSSAATSHVRLGTPIAPMLAAPARSIDVILAKCPNGLYSEVKYDGERVQIHRRGDELFFFARSLKPMRPDKYAGLEAPLLQALRAQDCILDGELLLVDRRTSLPLPFGTLGKHKKTMYADACTCIFLFDLLHLNGQSLLQQPLRQRRAHMKSVVREVEHRVAFSELCVVDGEVAQRRHILLQHFHRAMAEGLEGLVLKDVEGHYEPRARHWLKLKKDYVDGLADGADLLVLGAWYGSGNKGGQLSTFLMGCVDDGDGVGDGGASRYKTVCRVGNGLNDAAIRVLSLKYQKTMRARTAGAAAPSWIDCHPSHLPDVWLINPRDADVMEVIGAELTTSTTHTSGMSIRFPRILRVRSDKDVASGTTLGELLRLYRTSKESGAVQLNLMDGGSLLRGGGEECEEEGGTNQRSMPQPPPPPTPTLRGASSSRSPPRAMSAPTEPPPSSRLPIPTSSATTSSATTTTTTTTTSSSSSLVRYVERGDATQPSTPPEEPMLMAHCVAVGMLWSTRGVMGRIHHVCGPTAEQAYAQSVQDGVPLGEVVVCELKPPPPHRRGAVFIATMMAQHAANSGGGGIPQVDDDALRSCLEHCVRFAKQHHASIHLVQPVEASLRSPWRCHHDVIVALSHKMQVPVWIYGHAPPSLPSHIRNNVVPPPPPPPLPAPAPAPDVVRDLRQTTRDDAHMRSAHAVASLRHSLLHRCHAQLVVPPSSSSSSSESVEALQVMMELHGANVLHVGEHLDAHLVPRTTHVVMMGAYATSAIMALERQLASTPTLLIAECWVHQCIQREAWLAEDVFHPRVANLLRGCRVVMSSLIYSEELTQLVEHLGAIVMPAWTLIGRDVSTHFIATHAEVAADEVVAVHRVGGVVVDVSWLHHTALARRRMPEQPYLLRTSTSATTSSSSASTTSPLMGLLCGVQVAVCEVGLDHHLVEALMAAVVRMGGVLREEPRTSSSTENSDHIYRDAQYVVMASAEYIRRTSAGVEDPLPLPLQLKAISPAWISACVRRRELMDPTRFAHHHRQRIMDRRNRDGGSASAVEPSAQPLSEEEESDTEEWCSNSSSTETFVEDDDERNDVDDDPEPPRKASRAE